MGKIEKLAKLIIEQYNSYNFDGYYIYDIINILKLVNSGGFDILLEHEKSCMLSINKSCKICFICDMVENNDELWNNIEELINFFENYKST